MNEFSSNPQNTIPEDEIDLLALAKTLWNGRRIIIKTVIIFTILGLFIAISTPKQYSASSIMVPQVSSGQNKLGGLSSLAAMAGFSMDMSTGSELSPLIYPQIAQSIPFQKELMYTKLNFEGFEEKISLYDYYTDPQYSKFNLLGFIKKYTIGLPETILGAIRGKAKELEISSDSNANIVQLTDNENSLSKFLNGAVSLSADQKQGLITLTANMPQAKTAAQLGQKAQEILQEKITKFKIEKAEAQFAFVQERYNEKEKKFRTIQENLARFQDKNKSIITELDNTRLVLLQSEYQIALGVLTALAKQLESAQIQVKEETPVFSIIQPISIPTESSKPNRKMILIIWVFLGGVVGTAWVFGKEYLKDVRKKWKEAD
ncbi:MAG: Wzz/FepE/Etk N-terminal domain-containing protein [Bacteroidales bacterium]|jgi:LPS O-antigen subunit length determinant protein (WzzB/FepE family)|nr:Wzz/FepE/Etk N-terminal domain-containing protein [Bacteroidales bacterium]